MEPILREDGWTVSVHVCPDATPSLSVTRGYVASLTAPTGAGFDANGPTRRDAFRSAALLAGLIEPGDPLI